MKRPHVLRYQAIRKVTMAISLFLALPSTVQAADDWEEYSGPFPTEALYNMCSQSEQLDKCLLYIQGLMYGINIQKTMIDKEMTVCLPDISPEEARVRMLKFILGTTKGNPKNNKDPGDWMAFMSLAAGNHCPKEGLHKSNPLRRR